MATKAEIDRWLKKLGKELDDRQRHVKKLQDYYDGKQALTFQSESFKAHFGDLFANLNDNFCATVVKAETERLTPEGFRMGAAKEEDDKDAWRIWQANGLDARAKLAHGDALVKGESYALVWAGSDDTPRITIEDALQMAVARDSADPDRRLAAFKRWRDESGYLFATLYLPDGLYKFRTKNKTQPEEGVVTQWPATLQSGQWERREVEDETWPLGNPLKVVPVVPFANDPYLNGTGRSELLNVIPKQDAINKLAADMLLAAEFAAHKQRWLIGASIPRDPETGQPIEDFVSAVNRIWEISGGGNEEDDTNNVRVGEFDATDLVPYVKAIEMWVHHLATTTRTPPHYFMANMGTFPSGESLKTAETGLVAKAREAMVWFGESWEEVIRLAFAVLDDPRSKITDAETIWRNPETRTEGEVIDAAMKLQSLEVPWEIIMEFIGMTQTQITRMKTIRKAEVNANGSRPIELKAVFANGGDSG